MRKTILLIVVMIGILMTGCGNLTTIDDDPRMILTPQIGYHKVVVDYNKRIKNVRLDYVPLESKKVYYIQEGKYILEYQINPKLTFEMNLTYNDETKDRDSESDNVDRENNIRKEIEITEEMYIELEGKNFEVRLEGGVGI